MIRAEAACDNSSFKRSSIRDSSFFTLLNEGIPHIQCSFLLSDAMAADLYVN
jgi:hypothetical protein